MTLAETEVVAEIETITLKIKRKKEKKRLKLTNTNSIHSNQLISNSGNFSNRREKGSKRRVNMLRDSILTKKIAMSIQLSYSDQMHSGVNLQIIF